MLETKLRSAKNPLNSDLGALRNLVPFKKWHDEIITPSHLFGNLLVGMMGKWR
jgi:hypothetical protein